MRRVQTAVCGLLLGSLLLPSPASGDIPPIESNVPEKPTKRVSTAEVPFTITADRRAKTNRLVIPKKFLDNTRAVSSSPFGKIQTVIAGTAIALAVAGGAFLLLRRRQRGTQVAVSGLLIGLTGLVVSQLATADIAPPISDVPRAWKQVAAGQQNVTIEIVEKGDSVQLILGTYYRSPSRDRFDQPKPPEDGAAAPESEKSSAPN